MKKENLVQEEDLAAVRATLLEESFKALASRGDEVATVFYDTLFSMYPEAKPFFAKTDLALQKKKLLAALTFVVTNVRKPAALVGPLRELGKRHEGYGVRPDHYPMVGSALLTTFSTVLGEGWTKEIETAWGEAYGVVVDLMVRESRPPQ